MVAWQTSVARAEMFVVKVDTGEVIWADSIYEEGSSSRRTMQRLVEYLLKRFPPRDSGEL